MVSDKQLDSRHANEAGDEMSTWTTIALTLIVLGTLGSTSR